MELRDAVLMIADESAAYPGLVKLAQSAYDQLTWNGEVDYRVLSDMIAEVSGKGVLRAIYRKYGSDGGEAILGPVLREIDQQKTVPPRGTLYARPDEPRPLPATGH
jgi:hypothetical protein